MSRETRDSALFIAAAWGGTAVVTPLRILTLAPLSSNISTNDIASIVLLMLIDGKESVQSGPQYDVDSIDPHALV